MIVDMILDRREGVTYNAEAFMAYCEEESRIFHFHTGEDVVEGMKRRDNEAVQRALCGYIEEQGYNAEICDYIRSVDWLDGLPALNPMCEKCRTRGRRNSFGMECWGTTEMAWTGCIHREV